MGGLVIRKVRMKPQAIAGLEIGDFGDRQGLSVAGYLHFDAGAQEVEGIVFGFSKDRKSEQRCDRKEKSHCVRPDGTMSVVEKHLLQPPLRQKCATPITRQSDLQVLR
jgi:hypothetical protein